ncbi:MAG: hypothetical protein HFI51_01140 [Lachnospiraceae bacterium]|nr:hypothetical protein [Lachnospiraceae bacterium]
MQGRDYAAAIRTAHMMQKLGLVDVDVRMNDKVEFITTQYADYEETKMILSHITIGPPAFVMSKRKG